MYGQARYGSRTQAAGCGGEGGGESSKGTKGGSRCSGSKGGSRWGHAPRVASNWHAARAMQRLL